MTQNPTAVLPVAAGAVRLLRGIAAVARAAAAELVHQQRLAREREQLADMSDAALKDAGLSRREAITEAEKPDWRR